MLDRQTFIRDNTSLTDLPFLPEMRLHLAERIDPLWKLIEQITDEDDCPPPFWAFPWAGGMGLARYILDHPEAVQGKRVLDFASGCGFVGIAAAKAGAKKVYSCDIDPLAQAACQMNAKENGVALEPMAITDLKRVPKGIDIILAGDVCYDHLMAHRVLAWLRLCAAEGTRVLLGDPSRAYAPQEAVQTLATYIVPTSLELEDKPERDVAILTF